MTTTLFDAAVARGKSRAELEAMVADGALTIKQASDFTGIGRARLYDLIKAKLIISMKGEGTQRLIPRRELVRYLADRLSDELTGQDGAH